MTGVPVDADQPPRRTSHRWRLVLWLGSGMLAAGGILVGVLLGFGGAPGPVPAGLPDPGPVTGWGLPVARLVADLTGVAVVGLLTTATLLPGDRGELTGPATRICRTGAFVAAGWAVAALAQLALTFSDFLARPVLASLDLEALGAFAESTTPGRTLLVQAAIAGLVALAAGRLGAVRAAAVLLPVALVGLCVLALTGHASAPDNRLLAVSSLVVHLVGVALWVGGLTGLLLVGHRAPHLLPAAVPRFSTLAAWCLLAVAASGAVNAALRLGDVPALVTTGYGVLVLGKTAALGLLGAFGWVHRRRTLPALAAGHPRTFLRLAAVEVAVMAATIGLAVGLSRTPPPVPEGADLSAATRLLSS